VGRRAGGGGHDLSEPAPSTAAPAPRARGRTQIVVPVYNEGDGALRIHDGLQAAGVAYDDLCFVYDFDEDTTLPFIRELARRDARVRGEKNTTGRGVVNALRHAFARCEAGPVVVLMGDLSDELGIVPKMIAAWRDGADVVAPSRYVEGGRQEGGGWLKARLSRWAGRSLWALGFPISDPTSNFKLYDGAWLSRVAIESTGGFEVALELCVKACREGRAFAEMPTVWKDRTQGTSRFRLMRWLPHYLRWYLRAVGGLLVSPFRRARKASSRSR
jgi:dolichol-phosphate mannosyltransferase